MRAAKITTFLGALLFAAPAFAADNLTIANCFVNNTGSPYTWAAGQAALVQCDTQGRLIVAPSASTTSTSVTQGTSPWADNITQFGGAAVVTGTGASGAGIPRITVSSDSFPTTQAVSGTVTAQQPANTSYAVTWTGQSVNQGTPATVANAWPTYLAQGGAALSTTNPIFEQTVGPSMNAPGTSGTIARSVQGVTNGVPLPVTGTVGSIGFATATSAAPSYTNNQTAPVSQTLVGALRVDASATTQPVSGTVTVNGGPVTIQGQYISTAPAASGNGAANYIQQDAYKNLKTSETGSADPLVGITPVITQSGTTLVAKAAAGNLYGVYAVNTTTTAGYLVCVNSTTAPTGTITPLDIAYLPGTIGATATINYAAGPPNAYSTGISCGVSTSITTFTAGGNAFIQARVR